MLLRPAFTPFNKRNVIIFCNVTLEICDNNFTQITNWEFEPILVFRADRSRTISFCPLCACNLELVFVKILLRWNWLQTWLQTHLHSLSHDAIWTTPAENYTKACLKWWSYNPVDESNLGLESNVILIFEHHWPLELSKYEGIKLKLIFSISRPKIGRSFDYIRLLLDTFRHQAPALFLTWWCWVTFMAVHGIESLSAL